MDSLNATRDRFYGEYRFADVFASVKRAPESVKKQISGIPGVERVETRVVADVKLAIPGFDEPVTGRLVSVPETGEPVLNRLYLTKGRMVDPWRDDEVIVSQSFGEAHGFEPGDTFGAVINGRWKTLRITGFALSPEFVLQIRPGSISADFKRYGILWMSRRALGEAYDMDGAFNDLALTLSPLAQAEDVITRLDQILDRYGGLGAISRTDQMSHRFLTEEFRQLQRSAELYPTIFIAVAAFLLNVVITRIVGTERDQVAVLKAFGYANRDVGLHYAKLVLLIVLIGVAAGVATGVWLGRGLSNIYLEFYRFPELDYVLRPVVALGAAFITTGAGLLGTARAVWKAVSIPPAEAMRPEAPTRYGRTLIEKIGLGPVLSQPTRIIARNVERKPVKAAITVIGISLSCSIMIAGGFFGDAVDFMVNVQFEQSQKEDLTATFIEPTSRKAVHELEGLPGVEYAEVFRSVPVRFRHGYRTYRTSLEGIEPGLRLHLLLDSELRLVAVPPSGILMTDYLADLLHVRPGDIVTVEVLEGERPVRTVPVVAVLNQYIGVMSYMDLAALNRLLREGSSVSGAYLSTDPRHQAGIYRTLLEMPRVAGTTVRKDEIKNFYDTQAEAMLFFTLVATILAGVIAFGVVYNSARISLAERSRELASLRVLGYTRGEISYILLGELGLLTLAAIPPGFLIGNGLCAYVARAVESDLFRIPVVIEPSTYSLAAAVVISSAAFSGLIVRRRLDHLDLVGVLKTRE
jgi:putative ABC transport system permease protein